MPDAPTGSRPGSDAATEPLDAPPDAIPRIVGAQAITAGAVGQNDTIGLCSTGMFAMQFMPKIEMRVTALSIYDFQGDGLYDRHEMGVFDAVGKLLAHSFVERDSELVNGFRTVSIQPLQLEANQVYLVAEQSPGQAYTAATGTCGDRFADTDQTPGVLTVSTSLTYQGTASEDTTNATNPLEMVFPNQFPADGQGKFFRTGASFEWVSP